MWKLLLTADEYNCDFIDSDIYTNGWKFCYQYNGTWYIGLLPYINQTLTQWGNTYTWEDYLVPFEKYNGENIWFHNRMRKDGVPTVTIFYVDSNIFIHYSNKRGKFIRPLRQRQIPTIDDLIFDDRIIGGIEDVLLGFEALDGDHVYELSYYTNHYFNVNYTLYGQTISDDIFEYASSKAFDDLNFGWANKFFTPVYFVSSTFLNSDWDVVGFENSWEKIYYGYSESSLSYDNSDLVLPSAQNSTLIGEYSDGTVVGWKKFNADNSFVFYEINQENEAEYVLKESGGTYYIWKNGSGNYICSLEVGINGSEYWESLTLEGTYEHNNDAGLNFTLSFSEYVGNNKFLDDKKHTIHFANNSNVIQNRTKLNQICEKVKELTLMLNKLKFKIEWGSSDSFYTDTYGSQDYSIFDIHMGSVGSEKLKTLYPIINTVFEEILGFAFNFYVKAELPNLVRWSNENNFKDLLDSIGADRDILRDPILKNNRIDYDKIIDKLNAIEDLYDYIIADGWIPYENPDGVYAVEGFKRVNVEHVPLNSDGSRWKYRVTVNNIHNFDTWEFHEADGEYYSWSQLLNVYHSFDGQTQDSLNSRPSFERQGYSDNISIEKLAGYYDQNHFYGTQSYDHYNLKIFNRYTGNIRVYVYKTYLRVMSKASNVPGGGDYDIDNYTSYDPPEPMGTFDLSPETSTDLITELPLSCPDPYYWDYGNQPSNYQYSWERRYWGVLLFLEVLS